MAEAGLFGLFVLDCDRAAAHPHQDRTVRLLRMHVLDRDHATGQASRHRSNHLPRLPRGPAATRRLTLRARATRMSSVSFESIVLTITPHSYSTRCRYSIFRKFLTGPVYLLRTRILCVAAGAVQGTRVPLQRLVVVWACSGVSFFFREPSRRPEINVPKMAKRRVKRLSGLQPEVRVCLRLLPAWKDPPVPPSTPIVSGPGRMPHAKPAPPH